MNSCKISKYEIIKLPRADEQSIKRLLKQKGVPMLGRFFFEFDPEYIYESRECKESDYIEYTWTKKIKPKPVDVKEI